MLAAAQLGKMSALAPLISAELQLSLTTVATLVSLLEVGGATLGVVAGVLASRLGLVRGLLCSLAALCLAAAGSALAGGAASLLAWRVVEAAGYLGVVVTAPVLVVRAASPRHTGAAMALWSTFVPVGIALGAWAWAGVAAIGGWRVAMGFGAGLSLLVLLAGAWAQRGSLGAAPAALPAAAAERARVPAAVWLLSSSFGCYAMFEVGLLALLPLYLTGLGGATVAEAGRWTALAALATIAGSAAAALWMRGHRRPGWPVGVSLFVPALLAFPVFVGAPPVLLAAAVAVALNAISGAYPGFAFAWLPRAAGSPAQLVRANGVFTQFGASGSLLGPPVMAAFVGRFGWSAAAWCAFAVTVPAAVLAMLAWRRIEAGQAATAGARATP